MKFDISSTHRRYFEEHHLIEFADVLTEKQLEELNQAVDQTTDKRRADATFFEKGRDLWRDDQRIRKIELNRRLSDPALQLTGERALMLCYDQLFVKEVPFQQPFCLKEVSCFQGMECAWMVCLKGPYQEAVEGEQRIFVPRPGHAVCFSPTATIYPSELEQLPNHRFLCIVYAQPKALYIHNENDPLVNSLKILGYGFGDQLFEKGHPVIYG